MFLLRQGPVRVRIETGRSRERIGLLVLKRGRRLRIIGRFTPHLPEQDADGSAFCANGHRKDTTAFHREEHTDVGGVGARKIEMRSVCRALRILRNLLVPKLCLGTHLWKLRFPSSVRRQTCLVDAKQSFAEVRAQTEFGHEDKIEMRYVYVSRAGGAKRKRRWTKLTAPRQHAAASRRSRPRPRSEPSPSARPCPRPAPLPIRRSSPSLPSPPCRSPLHS